jgi:chorismate mutase / prephenate dehydratase
VNSPRDLPTLRQELDRIDTEILNWLAQRVRVVEETAELKRGGEARLRDPNREREILERISALARAEGVDRYFATSIFRAILNHSVRLQTDSLVEHGNLRGEGASLRVGFQGTEGAYSHLAILAHFGSRGGELQPLGFDTFAEVVEAVEAGDLDYGMLPIENTTAGSINDNYDLLHTGNLSIVGEEVVRVDHCLLAVEPVDPSRIRRVLSHPQAIAQCSTFLRGLSNCAVESFLDTAQAARKVAEEGDLSQAAIASREAAERYGLAILREGIANQRHNFTRFVVVARDPIVVSSEIPCKTSLILTTAHRKGALASCLAILNDHGLNLTKLESRPQPGTPWEYLFYLDFEGNVEDPQVRGALQALEEHTGSRKLLGSYPAWRA